jgi:hypothetical protein
VKADIQELAGKFSDAIGCFIPESSRSGIIVVKGRL